MKIEVWRRCRSISTEPIRHFGPGIARSFAESVVDAVATTANWRSLPFLLVCRIDFTAVVAVLRILLGFDRQTG